MVTADSSIGLPIPKRALDGMMIFGGRVLGGRESARIIFGGRVVEPSENSQ